MKILKWIAYCLLVIVLIVVAFSIKAVSSTEQRLNKKYAFTLPDLSVKPDSAIIAEGHRLMITKGCQGCHGDDLGGKIWIDDPSKSIEHIQPQSSEHYYVHHLGNLCMLPPGVNSSLKDKPTTEKAAS